MLRIGGLASGIDTDTMVTQLIKAHSIPVDRMIQQRQIIEWQRDAFRDMNLKMTDFRNNKLSNYRLQGTFIDYRANIKGDTTAVSAKAVGDVQGSALTIKVDRLATAAAKWSYEDIRSGNGELDTLKALNQQIDALDRDEFAKTDYTIKINGKEINIYVQADSIESIISKINHQTDVTAFYDNETGRISFKSDHTGVTNGPDNSDYIVFEDDDNFLRDTFKINVGTNSETDSTRAMNADVTINGMQTNRTDNVFVVNGIEVTLLEATGREATIGMARDTDKIFDAVMNFVKEYNEMLELLNGKIGEEKYRDYRPLTEDQKNAMTDKEIDRWEEMAKSGLLKNDPILSKLANTMRTVISSRVEVEDGKFLSLSSLGIKSGSYTERGKLYVDEFALREAIEADPDAVTMLFTKRGNDNSSENTATSGQGIGTTLYAEFKLGLDEIVEKAGSPLSLVNNSFIGKSLESMNERIEAANRRLSELEARYYRQFSAMETAMHQLNSQSIALANMFNLG